MLLLCEKFTQNLCLFNGTVFMTHRAKVIREILLTWQSILPCPLSMNMERPHLGRLYRWLLSCTFHLWWLTMWWLVIVWPLAVWWLTAYRWFAPVSFARAELSSTFHWGRPRWPSHLPPWRHSSRQMFVTKSIVKYHNLTQCFDSISDSCRLRLGNLLRQFTLSDW